MKKSLSLLLAVLFSTASTCSKQDTAPALPLVFKFELLNDKGDTTTTFLEGENITLRFSITNTAEKRISLYNYYADFASTYSETFWIDQKNRKDDGTGENWTRLGRACYPAVSYLNGQAVINANSTSIVSVKWLDSGLACQANNMPLRKGEYRARFTEEFTGNGGEYDSQSSIASFTILFTVN